MKATQKLAIKKTVLKALTKENLTQVAGGGTPVVPVSPGGTGTGGMPTIRK